ncbi:t-SNARE [Leucogyrophana mollusca]|uniref:t-SNARE n=1 Tax=Leucogyrophana mollusca TaxID=85980 RepID=A0ACB8BH60_9AGAM|nr:t-SNARE [Leucogyrophana mollusca]
MARDRLAALRAQRQVASPTGGPGSYEMQGTQSPAPATNGSGAGDSMSAFYAEITSIQDAIQQFDANVTRISDLHSRSLNSLDETGAQQNAAQLDELAEETRQLSNGLSQRIKSLEGPSPSGGQDAQIRKNRIAFVRSKFMETLQRYQDVERQYRARYKQRVERQFKIVKPDATPEEVAAVVNDDSGGGSQIFAQALTSSNRYGESRAAYREVQERHQDIRRIEQTLAELAQLFNDMGTLLGEQEEKIDAIQTQAAGVVADTEGGNRLKHTETAVKHARSARRKKWICFWITVIVILAAIGIGVGVYFGQHPPGKSNSSNGQ